MRSQLESRVAQMKAQTMTFRNDGVELCLNVPDNASMVETLQMFITTIAQQQEQIVTLHSVMNQMSIDNAAAQESLIAWTGKLAIETQNSLQQKLNDSNRQIQNFAYNIQGFGDSSPSDQQMVQSNFQNMRPSLPILRNLNAEVSSGGVEDAVKVESKDNITDYITDAEANSESKESTKESIQASAKESTKESNEGDTEGAIKRDGEITAEAERVERAKGDEKEDEEGEVLAPPVMNPNKKPSPESKAYYDSISINSMPTALAPRWRWAIHRVLSDIRRNKLKVPMTKHRVVKGSSVTERLARLESLMFLLPIDLKEQINRKANEVSDKAKTDNNDVKKQLNKKIDAVTLQAKHDTDILLKEIKDLGTNLSEHKEKTRVLKNTLTEKIDDIKSGIAQFESSLSDLDRNVSKMKRRDSARGSVDMKAIIPLLQSSDTKDTTQSAQSTSGPSGLLQPPVQVIDNSELERIEDEIEKEIESLDRRMRCMENTHAQTLQNKLQDLESEVQGLQDDAVSAKKKVDTCRERLTVPIVSGGAAIDRSMDGDGGGSSSGSGGGIDDHTVDNIVLMSELDGVLKDTNRTVWAAQSKASSLLAALKSLRKEITLTAATKEKEEKDDKERMKEKDREDRVSVNNDSTSEDRVISPRSFASESIKRDMLTVCDELEASIQGVSSQFDGGTYGVEYNSVLTKQWMDLVEGIKASSPSQYPAYPSELYGSNYQSHTPPSHHSYPGSQPQSVYPMINDSDSVAGGNNEEISVNGSGDGTVDIDKTLSLMKKEIRSKGSLHDIRVISLDAINHSLTAALNPIRSKISTLESDITSLKGVLGNIRERVSKDHEWLESMDVEFTRRDTEQKIKDEELILKNIELLKIQEIEKKKEKLRKIKEQNDILPPGFIACSRQEIEIPFTEAHSEHSNLNSQDDDDDDDDTTFSPNKFKNSMSRSRSRSQYTIQNIEEGCTVRVISGNHRGQGGVVVKIRDLDDDIENEDINNVGNNDNNGNNGNTGNSGNNDNNGTIDSAVLENNLLASNSTDVLEINTTGMGGGARRLSGIGIGEAGGGGNKQYRIRLEDIVTLPSTVPSPNKRNTRPSSALPRGRGAQNNGNTPYSGNSDDTVPKTNLLEIMKLRDEITTMEIALKTLGRDKIDTTQAQLLIELNTANTTAGDDKIDAEQFAVVETAVKNLTHDLDDLRTYQSKKIALVKKQFEESFNAINTSNSTANDVDLNNQSSVITTGQCLGCGRVAAIHNVPCLSHSPETLRAGFRMPIAVSPPPPFRAIQGPPGGSETLLTPFRTINHVTIGGGSSFAPSGGPGGSSVGSAFRTLNNGPGGLNNGFSGQGPSSPSGGDTQSQQTQQPPLLSQTQLLSRPMSAIIQSRNAQILHSQSVTDINGSNAINAAPGEHMNEESVDLKMESTAPQYTISRPKTSSGVYSASQRTSSRGAAAAGLSPVGTGVVVKAIKQLSRPEQWPAVQSVPRSGFTGKKSVRAEIAYAPERFEVPQNFSQGR